MDNEYREYTNSEGHKWREYKLDRLVALRIKELSLGLNGTLRHSYRALAIQVTGYECQKTGEDLERLAAWTLNEDWSEWNELKEASFPK